MCLFQHIMCRQLSQCEDPEIFLANVSEFNVAVNPKKTKLGLAEVEYVVH